MVENCFSVAVFCVCSAIFAVLLRQHCHEQSLMIALAACVAVIGGFMVFLAPLVSDVQDIFSQAGISDSYISLIFKAAAVCFITQITCEICRDSGENAIASAAEMWGRGAVTFMSLPVLKALLERINEII
ncbi:MAG: stage III sporulation AC/AD family protein [Ruminococcus sp.]|nr:stage III sporulation AC/AD family protein [Ruminococcus sp.]